MKTWPSLLLLAFGVAGLAQAEIELHDITIPPFKLSAPSMMVRYAVDNHYPYSIKEINELLRTSSDERSSINWEAAQAEWKRRVERYKKAVSAFPEKDTATAARMMADLGRRDNYPYTAWEIAALFKSTGKDGELDHIAAFQEFQRRVESFHKQSPQTIMNILNSDEKDIRRMYLLEEQAANAITLRDSAAAIKIYAEENNYPLLPEEIPAIFMTAPRPDLAPLELNRRVAAYTGRAELQPQPIPMYIEMPTEGQLE